MAYGLGKDSPIKLAQGKDNFEALIDRHGQWVRWRVAEKCPCITETLQPDIRCKTCRGSGFIYTYQKTASETLFLSIKDNIITLPSGYENDTVIKICDTKGNDYTWERYGNILNVSGKDFDTGDKLTILITASIVKDLEYAELTPTGGGFYQVKDCNTQTSAISGVYYTAVGDIVHVDRVVNGMNNLTVKEIRQNMILIEPAKDENGDTIPIEGDVVAYGIKWVPPFRFLVLSQQFTDIDAKIIETTGGDAMMTYPYRYDVAENDVITILSGDYLQKEVVKRSGEGKCDILNAFFVSVIQKVFTQEKEMKNGVDYILCGTNQILWLSDSIPPSGGKYSIIYKIYPTYTVIKNLHSMRTSEDQRLTKRVVLKLFAAFREGKKVNRND